LLLGCMIGIRFSEHLEDDGATVFAHACSAWLLRPQSGGCFEVSAGA
jgi:hypothetical protein